MKEYRITINVPEDIHQDFKMIAVSKKKTMTNILTSYIKEVIEKEKSKKKRKKLK